MTANVAARIDGWKKLMRSARTANDTTAEVCFKNLLFGAEMVLKDLGLSELAAAARHAAETV